ncbi:quinone oxidoreductase family protein [Oceanidesulfovibrio marinus]|uniref:Quinone oxidoreductase n=1 Tax=Oceanidesulfovibrio marinus TaxID=370038 RepID=A0A6P1ZFF1_9BACT|nr:quinone oxidoreductase [Oceanidesulfovibrio marinus]TVM32791.1 quinone oxidoreductase [Oceanidesulfovibrio marinus]
MSKAIVVHETGGPEVLHWEEHNPGEPASGEVRLVHEAVGLNFIDVYFRTGLYPLPSLPAVIGMEGAGVVDKVGEGVTELKEGDRVAYAGVLGAYAQVRCIPADRLVPLPDAISTHDAAGMMLQGMTARYLLKGCYPVGPGTTLLITAAAGGVGSILCQWAKHLGATVLGLVGSEEKAETARKNGCDHPILYRDVDFVAAVRELTNGEGVDVAYDSVGQATFLKTLDCVRPMGTIVPFGQSSGDIEPFDLRLLSSKGSLFLTRPSLMDYTRKREDLLAHAKDLFDVVTAGVVTMRIMQEYPLSDVAQAHRDMEGRKTRGSTVLIP